MKEFDIRKAGNDAGALPLPDYVNVKKFAASIYVMEFDIHYQVGRHGTAVEFGPD